ncbi:Patatin-like phospholipase domain-containing protein [Porphyridium purpureum]|uniref:Patatin-like phospholipase domain-containing protein n=1 Tax=Porphyridium purpureum TaxID=35688 RepID=A0A5J4Z0X5_PORPP|nr:Patatin-like phospholipase domain-containing protein [Porphyridium purpureum]|eukprot:POR3332..scf208_2
MIRRRFTSCDETSTGTEKRAEQTILNGDISYSPDGAAALSSPKRADAAKSGERNTEDAAQRSSVVEAVREMLRSFKTGNAGVPSPAPSTPHGADADAHHNFSEEGSLQGIGPRRQSSLSYDLLSKFEGTPRGNLRRFRWPLLALITSFLLFYLMLYALVRLYIVGYELLSFLLMGQKRRLLLELSSTSSYSEWASVAQELDTLEKYDAWKKNNESPYYDSALVLELINKLEAANAENNVERLMETLGSIYNQNLSGLGIDNSILYTEANFGTKFLIDRFVVCVVEATLIVFQSETMSPFQKHKFFRKCIQAYGKSALCLSSGGYMGMYHFGVCKALLEEKLIPTVVSGSSAGAMAAAIIATRTDEELREFLHPSMHQYFTACDESWVRFILRYLSVGAAFDTSRFYVKMKAVTFGDMTFQEAYEKTGRTLAITVTSTLKYGAPVILSHVTAPDVVIWSAVVASSAMPGLLKPVQLFRKRADGRLEPFSSFGMAWSDGVIKNDIPKEQLSQLLNVNWFIVSQTNPHVVPFMYQSKGSIGDPNLRRRGHGSGLHGGFFLSTMEALLRLEMRKWITLIQELDLLPLIFGVDFSKFVLQQFTGQVTIVPKRGLRIFHDYLRIIRDPDFADMEQYLTQGARFTWKAIAMIRNHLILEQTLAQCERELAERLAG